METSKFYKALEERDEYDFLKLLETDEDVNVKDADGHTLLHMAVIKLKSFNAFKTLLDKIDITIRDEDGNTAADLLMADPDFPDEGESLLRDVVKATLRKKSKAELEKLFFEGWMDMWLSESEMEDKDEDIKAFVRSIPDFQTKVQVIHNAIRDGEVEIVATMAETPGMISAADRTGLPPLHKAVVLGMTDIMTELAQISGSLTAIDHMGRTALHHAAGKRDGGHYYQILTEAGADPNATDKNGRTALEIYENPDLFPGEKVYERMIAALDRPVHTTKVKKSAVESSGSRTGSPSSGQEGSDGKKKRKPIQIYISPDVRQNPPPTTVDGRYVAEHLGGALTQALADIVERRPADPIEFLAQWLYKHSKNMEYSKRQADLLAQIRDEEAKRELDIEMREKRRDELHALQEAQRQKEREAEEEKQKQEQEELQRQAKEAALAQRPGLATVTEEKEDEPPKEKAHKDETGQTELHKLAGQTAADLTTLLNMGYSPADRDGNNKTARDVAEESGHSENVEAIDNYIRKLVEMQDFDTILELMLAGYDKFDIVFDTFKQSTSLPEETQDFLKDIPDHQERISNVFKSVQVEGIRELQQSLERKKLIKVKDEYGRSLLHIAVLMEHKEAVEFLSTSFPVVMKSKDNLDRTPLHYAMAVSPDLCQALEQHGADTLAEDAKQKQPTYYKENPEEIQTLKGSLPTLPITSTQQGEQQSQDAEPVQDPEPQLGQVTQEASD